ncbi:SDR family NAD(P)-dependent oxidoreductase [Methylohalobius crimeensis]|uniref:SDR family NAD(P)-dependent oxidoreductase n=1 Tax=Methylohalobius crimeensis TaxID=244365 RepID=UPI0004112007|nr:SDR family NAD(P)-dependent oxidoreductase [Methylohalobius crimeensis]
MMGAATPAAVVVGVGPETGLGAALARRFAAQGLPVFIAGRTERKLRQVAATIESGGGRAIPVVADATVEDQVKALFEAVDGCDCVPELVACTVDKNLRAPLLDTESEAFEALWRANSLAAFQVGREALRRMARVGRGTLIFTGASASLRSKPPFAGFASAKFALRGLAQGMAREFGPKGIHVVHVVIDGVIDGERARTQFPDLVRAKGENELIRPASIAEVYWQLHCQPPDAWTHEMDLRPFAEGF